MEIKKRGRPSLPKEKVTRLGIFTQVELWEEFKELAHSNGLNASEAIRTLMKQYIQENKGK